jgi:hypothetical protein
MNRPYTDITDTIFIKCSVCGRQLLYTASAIDAHEQRCNIPPGFDPSLVIGIIVPVPPRPRRS